MTNNTKPRLRLVPAEHGDDCLYVGAKWRSGVCDDWDHIDGFKLQEWIPAAVGDNGYWVDVPMVNREDMR